MRTQQDESNHQEWFVEQCARVGLKATQQRREIYAELVQTVSHPDAETIHTRVRERMPAISLDTVYRNLRSMEDHGLIQKVGATGYRSRFDANMRPHHHFVCSECGLIRDFYDTRLDDYQPLPEVRELGKVCSLRVELRGVCQSCRARAKEARNDG